MVPTALETLILLIESLIRLLEAECLPRARLFGLPLPNPAARAAADLRHISEALAAIAAARASSAPQAPTSSPAATARPSFPRATPHAAPASSNVAYVSPPPRPIFKTKTDSAPTPTHAHFITIPKQMGSRGSALSGSRAAPWPSFLQ